MHDCTATQWPYNGCQCGTASRRLRVYRNWYCFNDSQRNCMMTPCTRFRRSTNSERCDYDIASSLTATWRGHRWLSWRQRCRQRCCRYVKAAVLSAMFCSKWSTHLFWFVCIYRTPLDRPTPVHVYRMRKSHTRPVHSTRCSWSRMACLMFEVCWLRTDARRDEDVLCTRRQNLLQNGLRQVSDWITRDSIIDVIIACASRDHGWRWVRRSKSKFSIACMRDYDIIYLSCRRFCWLDFAC